MTTTLDEKRRAVIEIFQAGDVVEIEPQGSDAVLLRRRKTAEAPRLKMVRVKGELFSKGDSPVTTEEVKRMLEDDL